MVTVLKLLGAALVIYGLLVTGLYSFQRRILFVPDTSPPDRIAAGLSEMQDLDVRTADGLVLRGWYRPPAEGRPVVVYFQGNAGNIGNRGFKVRPLLDGGHGVLLVGYRGYGGNPGQPSEAGLLADGRAALDHLAAAGMPADRVVLYGESLGSGVAVQLAGEYAVAGMVLESPYTSITDVAAAGYWYVPVRLLLHDRFESLKHIGRLRAPLLVLHGERDRVIPPSHGKAIFAAAPEPKWLKLFPAGGHADLYDHGAGQAVLDFLDRL